MAFNKTDVTPASPAQLAALRERGLCVVETSAVTGAGLLDLRQALLRQAPADFLDSSAIVADLVGPGELAVLVVPIDKEAPKGRLILPQVQVLRDLLDHDAFALVVKERELRAALAGLRTPPRLVITDSQAFLKVAADTPAEVPLTSFSILFARLKGDLVAQVEGALAIEQTPPRRSRAGRGSLRASPHRGGHWPGEDSPLAHPVRGRPPRFPHRAGTRLPGGSVPLSAHRPLRRVHHWPA